MNKITYVRPEVEFVAISTEDICQASTLEVFADAGDGGWYGEETEANG